VARDILELEWVYKDASRPLIRTICTGPSNVIKTEQNQKKINIPEFFNQTSFYSILMIQLRTPHLSFTGKIQVLHILLAGAVKVPFFIAAFNGFAFVILAFSFYQCDRQFDFAAFKIELERYQGVPLFIDLAIQPFDFLLVQK